MPTSTGSTQGQVSAPYGGYYHGQVDSVCSSHIVSYSCYDYLLIMGYPGCVCGRSVDVFRSNVVSTLRRDCVLHLSSCSRCSNGHEHRLSLWPELHA